MDKKFKIIIAGDREFNNFSLAKEIINQVLLEKNLHNVCVVSGGIKGADSLGEEFAKLNGCDLKVFKANWMVYHEKAGTLRDEEMIKFSDAAILFWNGESMGTHNMITLATENNKTLFVVYYDKYTQQLIEIKKTP